jgi:hypothetical protein
MIQTKVPQIDVSDEDNKVFLKSCPTHYVKPVPTSTPGSTSTLSFLCPSPSRTTFMDRRIRFRGVIHLDFTGTTSGGGVPLLNAGYDAPRCRPFQSIVQTANITIDNQSFTFLPSQMMVGLTHYFDRNYDEDAPAFTDKYQNYADGINAINNPLGGYATTLDHNSQRGACPFKITANSTTAAAVDIYLWEQLFVPPFKHHTSCDLGITNFSNMDIQFIFSGSMSRVWSHAVNPNVTLTSVTASWGSGVGANYPTLFIDYFTNTPDYIPKPIQYKCDQYGLYKTGLNGPLAPGGTATVSSNSFQFSVIPNKIYIWVQQNDSSKTFLDSDTFARIDTINLSFGNVTGVLSSADTHVLYMMSKKNGLRDSFVEWYGQFVNNWGVGIANSMGGGVGSVLCLEFGSDIPLVDFHPGQTGSFNFQISTMGVTNINPTNAISLPILYVLTQTDGYLHMGDTVTREFGVQPAGDAPHVSYNALSEYYGAGFKDSIMKIMPYLQRFNKYLQDSKVVSTVASTIPHPVAQAVGTVAKNYGYGVDDIAGGPAMGIAAGVGGRVLSNAEIKRRIKRTL